MNDTVEITKDKARYGIIYSSFKGDQENTMQRWRNTFKKGNQNLVRPTENEIKNKQACNIMQLVLAAIATADFKIKTTANGEFHPPSAHLQLTDYISHGNRVIFDMSNLSAENKSTIQPMFEGLNKRASTHTLRPNEAGGFYEIKSMLHGLREFFIYTTGFSQNKDFGVSLYMGGDKPNFSGGTSKFGSDGHVLVVKKNDNFYLIGPEQTAPGSRPANGLTANQDPTFGLADTHSVLGNADQYTLAGSVYFDNLIYRLKLFNETKTLPPIKYDGMKVVINNDNFQSFKTFFDKLSAETSEVALEKMLTSKPVMFSDTAAKVSARKFVSQITDKDLEALFKQLRSVQHACAVENADSESPIAIMSKVLLEATNEMKLDSPECYQQTTEFARINNICTQIQKHHNKMRMPQNNDSLLPELVVIAMMAGLVTAVCLFSAPVGYIFLAAAVITFTYLLMTNYQQASESLHMSLAIG